MRKHGGEFGVEWIALRAVRSRRNSPRTRVEERMMSEKKREQERKKRERERGGGKERKRERKGRTRREIEGGQHRVTSAEPIFGSTKCKQNDRSADALRDAYGVNQATVRAEDRFQWVATHARIISAG